MSKPNPYSVKKERRLRHYTCEGRPYTEEEVAFLVAVDAWKRRAHKPHPSWADLLAIARALGY